ncbi:hypothetical protein QT19_00030, partial [Staphylococcus aureus]
ALIRHQRGAHVLGRDELLVLGVGLEVPAQAEIEGPVLVRRPVVLREQADLGVVGAGGPERNHRDSGTIGRRGIEVGISGRVEEIAAIAVRVFGALVLVERDLAAELEDVIATIDGDVVLHGERFLMVV